MDPRNPNNYPPNPQQPRPAQQQQQPVPDSTDFLHQAAHRYWAEMDGESRIIGEFFKLMSEMAKLRRAFLEKNGHLLQQYIQSAGNGFDLPPDAPQPSPRVNGVMGEDPDGARTLAARMRPNGRA